jgi:hypothetical protein
MNAQEPEETISLNVRAILSVMRSVGLEFERSDAYIGGEDGLLTGTCTEKRLVPVSLVE